MTKSPPYDRTTPPSDPRFNNHHSQSPRHAQIPQTDYVNPRDALPAVWPRDPSPPLVFYGPQDVLYNAFTRNAHLNMTIPGAPDLPNRLNPYPVLGPMNDPTRSTQPCISINIRRLPDKATWLNMPETIATLNHMKLNYRNLPTPAPKPSKEVLPTPLLIPSQASKPAPKPSTKAKPAGWVSKLRKKPRPVFNAAFSFDEASCRPSSGHTPPVSPRTSFSILGFPQSSAWIEEPPKRKRIDSTEIQIAQSYPFDKPKPVTITRSRDLTNTTLLPRGSRPQRPVTPLNYSNTMVTAAEAHPGHLVDFTTSSPTAPSPHSDYQLRLDMQAHYDHLTTTSPRRKSFPDSNAATARRHKEDLKMLAKLDALDAEAKEFVADQGSPNDGRKRACTLERRRRTSRKSAASIATTTAAADHRSSTWSSTATTMDTFSSSDPDRMWPFILTPSPSPSPSASSFPSPVSVSVSSASFSSSAGDALALRRTVSDPSTAAFLAHIRASVEARKEAVDKWQQYQVFADEVEKGFLGDEPI